MASPDGSFVHHPTTSTHPTQFESELESLFAEVNALSLVLNRAVHVEFAGDELSAGEKSMLRILKRNGPQTVPQIARARCTSRQNIQVQVNRLARQGCLETKINPGHKRSVLLCLSARGERLLGAAEQQHNQLNARLEPFLVANQLRAALEVLRGLRGLLEPQAAPGNHVPVPDTPAEALSLKADLDSEKLAEEDTVLPVNLL